MSSRKPPEQKPDGRASGDWVRAVRDLAPFLGIGTTLAVTVLAGTGGGYWLDARFGTGPLFVLLGAAVGLGAGLYHFFKTVTGPKR